MLRRLQLGDAFYSHLTRTAAITVLVILGGIIISLFDGSWLALRTFGFNFLLVDTWNPVTEKFGAIAPIYGTLVTSFVAMLIAVPVGLFIALFLTELCPMWLRRPIGIATVTPPCDSAHNTLRWLACCPCRLTHLTRENEFGSENHASDGGACARGDERISFDDARRSVSDQETEQRHPTSAFLTAMGLGLRMMRRSPLIAAGFLGATLVQGAVQGLLIWALRHVLESFGKHGELTPRIVLANGLAIFAVWLLRSLSVFTAETMSVQLSHRVEIRSMLEVLGKLLRLSVRFFDRSHQADVIMAAYHDLKGVRTVTLEVGRMVLYLSQLAGLAVAAWMMSPSLAVAGLVAVPLGVLPAYWFGRAITGAARGEREAVSTLHQSFYQVTSSIRVIKVNRSESRVLVGAQKIGRELHRHLIRQAVQKGLARLLLETVSGLGLIVVLTMGGYQVARGTLAWEALLGLMVAMMAVYSPVVGLVQVYGGIRSIIPNLDRIEQIHREVVEVQDRPDARRLPAAPRVIELDQLSFSHDSRPVLDGVTARFGAGERIGIVGPSGAGKSTLVSLLLRFYDPSSGAIRLDGVDLRDIRHADWMDRTAIVLQEPVVFHDTVANNIRLGRPDAGMDDVIAAGRAANIHDEIMAMEHGYDTLVGVGSGGRGVSVGQKQRICIAAALLKDAPVLFLDEATSSLDAVSERKVQAAIDHLMQGRTTFVVAHRFSTLRNVDRILVLDQGRLAGLGAHADLVKTCGVYRTLWESQGAPALTPPRSAHGLMEAYPA